ncbi:MAG: hypothetical protein HRT87_01735 [Legionellales bacterium]|nr:hypothetical protein [Legionellales bacterium]
MRYIIKINFILISLIILSGCDFFFNKNNSQPGAESKKTNINKSNVQGSNNHNEDLLNTDNPNKERKALVFFQYEGSAGQKQQTLLNNLKARIQPSDITIVRKNVPVKFNLDGHYDYVLFTGDHGEFINNKPVRFNGIRAEELQRALLDSNFSAEVLVFDTCFSCSFIPHFVNTQKLRFGNKIICAYGECQGYAQAISDSNDTATLGTIFNILLQALDDLGANYNSLSIYIHGGLNQGKLYVRKYQNIKQAIESARFLGITDTVDEINSIEHFLKQNNISIMKFSKQDLKKQFYGDLNGVSV